MLRKLRILISTQHALMLAYRAEIYLWVLALVLPFIMMAVWTTAASSSSGSSFSMSPLQYARYFAAVFIARQFSTVWMIYEFEYNVVEGRLSYLLLRPFNPIWQFVAAHIGEQIARAPFFLVVLIAFFCINPQAIWVPSIPAIILTVLAIYAAFAVRFALQYCFAMVTFHFERAASIEQLSMVPYLFLSGIIIPISDLLPHIARIANFTPFPYTIYFPASILTGQIAWSDPAMLQGFGMLALWFIALRALGAALWKRGLRQYSGQGA